MAWEPLLWIVLLIMNAALFVVNVYQYVAFSDLEDDHINPYELSSRINYVIVPEYILHGVFCISFLVTGHWIMFLVTLPPAYYNIKQYLSRQHLCYATEIFRVLDAENKVRKIKMGFYGALLILVFVRLVFSAVFVVFTEDDDIRGFGLS